MAGTNDFHVTAVLPPCDRLPAVAPGAGRQYVSRAGVPRPATRLQRLYAYVLAAAHGEVELLDVERLTLTATELGYPAARLPELARQYEPLLDCSSWLSTTGALSRRSL